MFRVDRKLAAAVVVAASTVGCTQSPHRAVGTYRPVELSALFASIDEPEDADISAQHLETAVRNWYGTDAHSALWSTINSVSRNERLEELIGFESFQSGDFSYHGLVAIRTGSGTCHLLYADGDLQYLRKDRSTVPAVRISRGAFERLSDRVGDQEPLASYASLGSARESGSAYLVHVLRDGKSVTFLQFDAMRFDGCVLRQDVAEMQESFAAAAIIRAVFACAPLEIFGGGIGDSMHFPDYDTRPAYPRPK